MILYINRDFFHYEAGNLCRLFFPYEELKTVVGDNADESDNFAVIAAYADDECRVRIKNGEKLLERTRKNSAGDSEEYSITLLMFKVFCEFTDYYPEWGMLTGIHPVKLYSSYAEASGKEEADRVFRQRFFVSEAKLSMLQRIFSEQSEAINALKPDDFSLYISIPFCPTRCAYCSFVSQSVEKQKKLIPPYVDKLLEEIEETAKITKETGLRLVSVYMGGGTPTTLGPEQLKAVLDKVRESFDMSSCTELTVEAGRPDTIDEDKIRTLLECGVSRISINPQSLNDKVLENIGRKHSAQDVLDKFAMVRAMGSVEINMDLIAGLEGDSLESFKSTLDKVIELDPENVTVHSLALKRSAKLFREAETKDFHSDKKLAADMIDYSIRTLTSAGYEPYYLYRQSRMAGNLENTGWAKKTKACRYNIYTMDETHTVVACGAGGVSKIKDPYSERLERIFNFKYSYEYLSRFNELITRKEEVKTLYEQFRKRLH